MVKPFCRSCRVYLKPISKGALTGHGCPRCHGEFFSFHNLYGVISSAMLKKLWEWSANPDCGSKRDCGFCLKPMRTVMDPVSTIEVDVCRDCKGVWFDPGEEQNLAAKTAAPKPVVPPLRASTGSAYFDAQAPFPVEEKNQHNLHIGDQPFSTEIIGSMSAGENIAGFFFLPVEVDQKTTSFVPVVTLTLIAVCVLTSVSAFRHPSVMNHMIFDSAKHGLKLYESLLTSFFVHGGWIHLLGNMYFLYIFGDNVEENLGSMKFLVLVALATLVGSWFQWQMAGGEHVRALGASGGIMGVMIYYLMCFPKRRFVMRIPQFGMMAQLRPFYVVMPALALMMTYLLADLVGALMGGGNVGHLCHLAGGAVGAFFYFGWGRNEDS